jgi:pyruvate/2-oxoglutarate dehydrogenase complex dihydrolipoamide acyltransferase (E2) component
MSAPPADLAILVPDLGTPTATLSVWHVRPGERVFEGDRIVELLIPGAVIDLPAPATGVVRAMLAGANDRVEIGQRLGTITPDPDG